MASSVQQPEEMDALSNQSEVFAPLAYEEFEDDVFEDATADIQPEHLSRTGMREAFRDCERAMRLFFNNDLVKAVALMKPWADTSLYHSLGTAIFEFIPAALTFDRALIERAGEAIKKCITVCNKNRKHYTFVESLGSMIKKPNFSAYTDLEAHAELCYAEALLLNAALHILEGEDLTGLIKGTLKVKQCYNTYQLCWNIKESKTWDSETSKLQFKSGVRLGTATFNLMIAMLPPRIVSLLEFVGISGNKYYGLTELEKGSHGSGLRAILCDLTLLVYHLGICQFVGGQGDMAVAINTLEKSLRKYPRSVWFLVFKARYQFLQGQLEEAIVTYKQVASFPGTFKQFRHVCYWELMWIYGLKMDYKQSAAYADVLVAGSSWSKTTHCYIKAAMMMQATGDTTRSDFITINELMRDAPKYKTRIAGKSLPMEKFVLKRCARYREQRGHLVLPALELLCIWNLLPLLRHNDHLLHNIMRVIERNTELLDTCEGEWWAGHKGDNKALLLYMLGCCLIAMNLPLSALSKFEEVLRMKRDIKEDTFLLPFAVCEMGWCHYMLGDMERAYNSYNDARKKYSGYSLESRLHFRVHARLHMVRDVVGNTKFPMRN